MSQFTASNLPTPEERPDGLHKRYKIEKADGSPVDPNGTYFVLRLDSGGRDRLHVAACRAAARTYSAIVEGSHLHGVAVDLLTVLVDLGTHTATGISLREAARRWVAEDTISSAVLELSADQRGAFASFVRNNRDYLSQLSELATYEGLSDSTSRLIAAVLILFTSR